MTLTTIAGQGAPEGAVVEWVTSADGTRLRVARWCPDRATRGTVVVLNGRTEFIEKYFEVVSDLLARGFAVATLDWRGQGLSDRPLANRQKGHVAAFSAFVADLHQVVDEVVRPKCPPPYRAICHSMGGAIGLHYLALHPGTFDAALFSAPMWGIGRSARTPRALRAIVTAANVLGLASLYVPGSGDHDPARYPFEENTLTSDRTRWERTTRLVETEPLLAVGGPTVGWVKQAFDAIALLHAPGFAEAIDLPIRVCSAGADALVSVAAQTRLAERLPNAKQLVLDGARHEILMEQDHHRDRVLAAFDEL